MNRQKVLFILTHLGLSVLLFLLCYQGMDAVSGLLFSMGLRSLDVLVFLALLFCSILLSWFGGGFLARKLLNRNMRA